MLKKFKAVIVAAGLAICTIISLLFFSLIAKDKRPDAKGVLTGYTVQ
jgi:hypothetical protein